MIIPFYKYQGTGNDFILIDDRERSFDPNNYKLVRRLCHRKYGIGADGLILLRNHSEYDFEMIYFNSDGHEGSMCGNGGRCIVQFAYDLGVIGNNTEFIAVDGVHKALVDQEGVQLKMNNVDEIEETGNYYYMNTGSPHFVSFIDSLTDFNVYEEGSKIRYSDRFKLEGTNVNFVQKDDNNTIFVRTYERGVEDETLSCGTGVTACALAVSFHNYVSPVTIKTLGGELKVAYESNGNEFCNIYLIGPATKVFEGKIEF